MKKLIAATLLALASTGAIASDLTNGENYSGIGANLASSSTHNPELYVESSVALYQNSATWIETAVQGIDYSDPRNVDAGMESFVDHS